MFQTTFKVKPFYIKKQNFHDMVIEEITWDRLGKRTQTSLVTVEVWGDDHAVLYIDVETLVRATHVSVENLIETLEEVSAVCHIRVLL